MPKGTGSNAHSSPFVTGNPGCSHGLISTRWPSEGAWTGHIWSRYQMCTREWNLSFACWAKAWHWIPHRSVDDSLIDRNGTITYFASRDSFCKAPYMAGKHRRGSFSFVAVLRSFRSLSLRFKLLQFTG